MRTRLYEVGWDILDVIFPPRCAGCGRWGERWCLECQNSTQLIGNEVCLQCGIPFAKTQHPQCDRCSLYPNYFYRLRSWAYYEGPIQHAIQELKYHRNFGLAISMSRLLAEYLQELMWGIDIIIPVPLSENRLEERGYNQAFLLAKPLARHMDLPLQRRGLKRIRDTQTQVGLSRGQRIANVRGAFTANPDLINKKFVLLIDDVVTTGATMNACAKALREADAERVYGLTVARSLQTAW